MPPLLFVYINVSLVFVPKSLVQQLAAKILIILYLSGWHVDQIFFFLSLSTLFRRIWENICKIQITYACVWAPTVMCLHLRMRYIAVSGAIEWRPSAHACCHSFSWCENNKLNAQSTRILLQFVIRLINSKEIIILDIVFEPVSVSYSSPLFWKCVNWFCNYHGGSTRLNPLFV